jgi:predicted RND superfamily exporter protein
VTTAIGLASLYTSDIVPIAKFGIYSALAVIGTLLLLFTYLPAALEIWPPLSRARRPASREEAWYEKRLKHIWAAFGGGIIRHHYLVAATCVLVIASVGYGVTRINTSVNLLKLFDADAKILADYAWLERHLGKLVPMEVVVKFDEDMLAPAATADSAGEEPVSFAEHAARLSFLDRMEVVSRVQQVVDDVFGPRGQDVAGGSLSAATFAPVLPPAQGDSLTFARRGTTNTRLEGHRDEFLRSEYLRLDKEDAAELWRVSIRIGALQDVDYGQFVSEMKSAVEPVLAATREREQILQAIAQERGNASWSGANVCLLGVPAGAFTPAETEDAGTAANEQKGRPEQATVAKDIDQTRIFSQTLREQLQAARLRVDWHAPDADGMPAEFAEILAGFDCVVLVADHAAYNMDVIRRNARLLVDVREHTFDPSSTISPPAHGAGSPRISAVYTGVVPIVYKAQRTLLNSLIQSTVWSFVTITPIMMFVSRGFGPGLVAMLPNVLPVFVIFGTMGWLGIQVDIGSMMTASIALGVAVDDTIHYLNWFREELGKTSDRKQAILAAYQRCATPTLQAAIISGLGLSVFAFSTFTPTQRFGILMLTILFAGVVAELVFFPALLAGPLGLVFKVRREKAGTAATGAEPPAAPTQGTSAACPYPHMMLLGKKTTVD